MNRCLRCDWTGDDLTGHVLDSGHPACIVCAHSLAPAEQRTCQRCVGRVRADLADIENLYAMLPDAAEALKPSWSASEGRSGGESHGIPGGDALVLYGPGSDGRGQTYAIVHDLDASHSDDEWEDDAPSALFTVASWEDDWRRTFHHPAAGRATITAAVRYLNGQLGRAAAQHPEFDRFAHDIRSLHSRMLRAAGAADIPLRAPADCFDCDGPLERGWTDYGLADDWTCRRCKRVYTAAEYMLAVRARLEERRAS